MLKTETPAYELELVAIPDMQPGPNVRKDVDPAEITALGASLKRRQHHPVILSPDRMLIDGYRRWLAAKEAGIEGLWAIVTTRPLSVVERIEAQLEMSQHRRDFTEQEKVAACEELLAAQPDLDQKRLAERLQVDPGTVSKWLSLTSERVIPAVREAFQRGEIGLKAAYPISQAAKEHQPALLQLALDGATREQLTTHIRRQRQTTPQPRVSRLRCTLPEGGSMTFTGTAIAFDDVIESLTVLLREAKRARDQGLDVKTWERVLADKAHSAS